MEEGWIQWPRPVVAEAEGRAVGLLVAAAVLAVLGVVRGHPVGVLAGAVVAVPVAALELALRRPPGARSLSPFEGGPVAGANLVRTWTIASYLAWLATFVLFVVSAGGDTSLHWWWGVTLTLGGAGASLARARRWARYEQATGGQALRRPWTWPGWAGTRGWTWRST